MRPGRVWWSVLPAIVVLGCAPADLTPISAEIARALAEQPVAGTSAPVWTDVRTFYQTRANLPAWVTQEAPSALGAKALGLIAAASAHGLAPGGYGGTKLAESAAAIESIGDEPAQRAPALARYDVDLTTALLHLGRDVALGRSRPQTLDGRWKPRRQSPDFAASLARAIDTNIEQWLASIAPPHPEYAGLQKGLAALQAQQEQGGWPTVPAARFVAGQSDPAVTVLRLRLAATGDVPVAAPPDPAIYDDAVQQGVARFQERHGLTPDGVAGASTLAAMNVPVEARIRQIEMNLDRWRWMPDDLGDRHLMVNIPAFHLRIREQGATVRMIRVVVGKRGNETPVFSDEMETVVFSPFWNIPDTIVEGETAPAILRDPNYIRRNGLEILRASGSGRTRVDPEDVDWENPEELRALSIRQRPGPGNALGHVKFLFPNAYSVYLHDTPADRLFERPGRAFSHGCVRVEEPQALAEYVLRGDPAWPPDRIAAAMDAGVEKHVRLPTPLPVHLVYFTAWPETGGGVGFFGDPYGYDARQAAGLAKR